LGVLLGRYKKLLALGGKLKITNVPPHIYKIMELSGLPKIIHFYTNEASAFEEGRGA
ncbi:MAG: STAS domain-containing protein, partial [Desulfitobacteriaceae bacterium]